MRLCLAVIDRESGKVSQKTPAFLIRLLTLYKSIKDTVAGIVPADLQNSSVALLHIKFLLKAANQTEQPKKKKKKSWATEKDLFEWSIRTSYFI